MLGAARPIRAAGVAVAVDWYVFYVRTYSQVDFSATTISSSCSRPYLELRDKDGKPIQSFSGGYVSETNHPARGKVLEQRVALQTLGAQYAQTLTVAEGQIPVSC